jgi:hypothetical protein
MTVAMYLAQASKSVYEISLSQRERINKTDVSLCPKKGSSLLLSHTSSDVQFVDNLGLLVSAPITQLLREEGI